MPKEPLFISSKFKHKLNSKVKFAEVDLFGVVHNIQYLYWLEWARTEYLENLGIELNLKNFLNKYLLMVVHSEIDYFASLSLSSNYEILTRVSFIKNSSIGFENIIISENKTIVEAKAILVHINPATKEPEPISGNLKSLIFDFEKENLIL